MVDLNKNGKLADKKVATVSRASGAPADVLVAAFRGEEGANSIVPGKDAFFVLSVKKATMPKLDTKKMAELNKEMQSVSMSAVQDDYNSFLMREYPVEINEKVYNRVFAK